MHAALAPRSLFSRLFRPGAPPAEPAQPAPEMRAMDRRQAALSAEIISCGRSHHCQVRNISPGGLTLGFTEMPSLFKGAQLLVLAGGLGPISGSVRWIKANECGMAFNRALAADVLDDTTALFDPGKRPRPGRAKIRLPATARAPDFEQRVMIEDIGSGGALLATDLPLRAGQGLMIEIEDLAPIGAHGRWSKAGRCGLMFSKLLPIRIA